MPKLPTPPVVALFAAADPTCGAGIYADIRAVVAQQCVPFAVLCGVAPQNLDEVRKAQPLQAELIREQFAAVRDAKFAAIKIGALFSAESVHAVAQCLQEKPDTPVIWDPVLAPTAGTRFANTETREAAKEMLLPRTTVIVPNLREARTLAGGGTMQGPTLAAKKLLARGPQYALVTDSESHRVHCLLYSQKKAAPLWQAECKRARGQFHGSGCLFAATLAARIAKGDKMPRAAEHAHQQTLNAIRGGLSFHKLGKQKLLPPNPPNPPQP